MGTHAADMPESGTKGVYVQRVNVSGGGRGENERIKSEKNASTPSPTDGKVVIARRWCETVAIVYYIYIRSRSASPGMYCSPESWCPRWKMSCSDAMGS